MTSVPVLEIEEAAFRAWPAAEVVELSGWRLRFTHGVTRRANSVWPNDWRDETTLNERLEAVEAFSAARGIAPSFQLTSAARPADLDAVLAARGYAVDAPVIVMTRELDEPSRAPFRLGFLGDRLAETGRRVAHRSSGTGSLRRRARRISRDPRAPRRPRRLRARPLGRGPVAVGLGVTDGPWLGIFAMLTLPEARRRGAAKAVLHALTSWGAARGARRAYLQVERDNDAARALYTACGFVPAYEYHYRTKFKRRGDVPSYVWGFSTSARSCHQRRGSISRTSVPMTR